MDTSAPAVSGPENRMAFTLPDPSEHTPAAPPAAGLITAAAPYPAMARPGRTARGGPARPPTGRPPRGGPAPGLRAPGPRPADRACDDLGVPAPSRASDGAGRRDQRGSGEAEARPAGAG